MKLFIVQIEIDQDAYWSGLDPKYKKGMIISIPVLTGNSSQAWDLVENHYIGSEYPAYHITHAYACDDRLFAPIIPDFLDNHRKLNGFKTKYFK